MTLTEQVARALCRRRIEFNCRQDEKPFPPEERIQRGIDHAWPDFVEDARAAIAAMRKPTPEMVEAAENSDFEFWSPEPGEGRDLLDLGAAWEAMIDVALKEELDTVEKNRTGDGE